MGRCHGSHPELSTDAATLLDEEGGRGGLGANASGGGNAQLARHYRFAIAMENGVFPNYVTEKLANAFVGGCQHLNAHTPLLFVLTGA